MQTVEEQETIVLVDKNQVTDHKVDRENACATEEEETIIVDNDVESPWPKLNKLFSLQSVRKQNLSFECLLCQPKKVLISTYITSHSNFRKHIKV